MSNASDELHVFAFGISGEFGNEMQEVVCLLWLNQVPSYRNAIIVTDQKDTQKYHFGIKQTNSFTR